MATKSVGSQTGSGRHKKRIKRDHNINDSTTITPNLSEDVVEKILSFLPIKHAAMCGLLSTRFKKYSWLRNPNFVFNLDFAVGRSRGNFVRAVNRIFNQHSGSHIQRFQLYFDATDIEAIVEYWVHMITSKGVEEVDLDFTQGDEPFNLPYHLLEFESIRILKLNFCRFELPPKLKGLCFLKTIALRQVNVTSALIATIFSNCLCLEGIDEVQCSGIYHLNIAAQELKKFRRFVVGDCKDMCLIDIDAPTLSTFFYRGESPAINFMTQMRHLKDVILNFTLVRCFPHLYSMSNLMLRLSVSNIEVLRISTTFLERLSSKFKNGTYTKISFLLLNLKEFHLFTDGAITDINPYDIVSFLKNCLYVDRVFLDLGEYSFEYGYYWKMLGKQMFENCDANFFQLKRLTVSGFKFEKLELEMLKFFLNKSGVLDSVELVPAKNWRLGVFTREEHDMYNQLFDSWKVSPNAKISILKSIELINVWSF
ncbi:putative FBD-associated F-box protein At1g61330 [Rhododendron vialii]|uniref:putative FBD-associated F-box protein At1g61330 n=1 Tax=Rhododendron vialii TaxID=182163 RepID=UPI0026602C4B|nr:putative FBD-associated F-box protein At1g61330 [Rhododendron vialii]